MQRTYNIICTILFTCQLLDFVQYSKGEINWLCKNNKTVAFRLLPDNTSTCHCLFIEILNPPKYGDGYIYTPGIGAHKLHKVAKTWNEARKVCIEEDAHLAILDSEYEREILRDRLQNEHKTVTGANRTDLAYLGVHDLFESGDWTTVLGTSPNYLGWNKKKCLKWSPQPYNSDGKQHCMTVIRDCYGTDDHWCDKYLPFFCEKPAPCP